MVSETAAVHPVRVAPQGVRLEELGLADAVRECAPDWPAFRARVDLSPFLHPDYLALWARTMGAVDVCRVIVARRGGDLVGFGPFAIVDEPLGPLSVRTLRLIGNNVGSPGDVIYSDLAADAPRREIVRAILGRALRWRTQKWDFGYLPPSSETASVARIVAAPSNNGVPDDTRMYVGLPLPRTWEAFLEGLSGNVRRSFHRRFRRLGEKGRVDVRVARDPESARRAVREMIRNHRRWWDGTERSTWFGDAKVERFLDASAGFLAERGQYLAFTLELDGQPIAWNVGAWDGARYFEQHISFDRTYAECSPGVLLGTLIAKNLVELGATKLELGPGFDERKQGLGGIPSAYERLRLYRGWLSKAAAVRTSLRGGRTGS